MFQTTNQLVSHSQCWLYLRLFPFVGPTCPRLVGWHVAAESPSRPSGRWAGPFRNGAGLGTLEKCQCLVLISWADHRKTIGKWRFTIWLFNIAMENPLEIEVSSWDNHL